MTEAQDQPIAQDMPAASPVGLALLCEQCGYDLSGLEPHTRCPECAEPVDNSRPERRVGSLFQQARTGRTLVRTWWQAIASRRNLQRSLRVDGTAAVQLALASAVTAVGLFLAGSLIAIAAFVPVLGTAHTVRFTVLALGIGVMAVPVLLGLTLFESLGLRFFASRRGWRVSRQVARTIVAHGCVGWVVSGASAGLGLALLGSAHALAGVLIGTDAGHLAPLVVRVGNGAMGVLVGVGGGAGFLYFEWFAYTGMRRCRYANPPDHDANQSSAEAIV